MFHILSNPTNTQFLLIKKHKKQKDTHAFVQRAIHSHILQCSYTWAIIAHDHTFIGALDLHPENRHSAEIGYLIAPEFQGHGYAQEACNAIVQRLASNSTLETILANCYPENAASIHILQKLGFKQKTAPKNSTLLFYAKNLHAPPEETL